MKRLLIVGMVSATAVAVAETVTLAPADGVTTNVLQVYSGDVDGDLVLANGAAVDFIAIGASPNAWIPVAAASGKITQTGRFRALNAGSCRRCEAVVLDGVLYVRPVETGLRITIR